MDAEVRASRLALSQAGSLAQLHSSALLWLWVWVSGLRLPRLRLLPSRLRLPLRFPVHTMTVSTASFTGQTARLKSVPSIPGLCARTLDTPDMRRPYISGYSTGILSVFVSHPGPDY